MTAPSVAAPASVARRRPSLFLGFTTVLRKEMTEWLRGPKSWIIAGISVAAAIFTTLVPFIVRASGEAAQGPPLSMDPTANVLLGWTGQTVALITVVATMALLSGERDRGTLAWSLTNPVSPTSIIAAKFVAAMVMLGITAVAVPLVVSTGVATVAYGSPPDFATVGLFAILMLTLPAFYVALTVGLGTFLRTTAGVAGVAFAVMFVPPIIGAFAPVLLEASPTSIAGWAMATATGQSASMLSIAGWAIAMVGLVVGSKLVFDRQEP